MKFLIDNQLPPALAEFLKSQGHAAHHVREVGLTRAYDTVIWRYAVDEDAIVVSKDEDFYFLATSPGNTVKLLWVRIGNCRTKALLDTLKTQLSHIFAEFESGSLIVEIR